jgi:sugar phosphate isomerase/epimerase
MYNKPVMKRVIFCFVLMCFIAPFSFGQRKLLKEAPGAVSYTFRAELGKDVPATLDKIKAMGITNMEFSGFFGQTPEQLRALLDARRMRCTSLGIGYNDLLNNPDKVIAQAKTLGAKFVRIGSIPHPGNFQNLTADVVKKAAVDFNTFGKKLKENGLTFCYHNHGPEFKSGEELGEPTFFDYLMKNTDPKSVFFEMDVMWVYWPGADPIAFLQKYPDRFKLMHVKNVKKGLQRGGPSTFVAVGDGQIDMDAVLRAARKTAIKYYYIEDESPAQFIDAQVPASVKYMEELTR